MRARRALASAALLALSSGVALVAAPDVAIAAPSPQEGFDTTFGTDGLLAINRVSDVANAPGVQGVRVFARVDGGADVVTTTGANGVPERLLVRRLSSGAPDPSVPVVALPGDVRAAVEDPDGSVTLALSTSGTIALLRVDSAGTSTPVPLADPPASAIGVALERGPDGHLHLVTAAFGGAGVEVRVRAFLDGVEDTARAHQLDLADCGLTPDSFVPLADGGFVVGCGPNVVHVSAGGVETPLAGLPANAVVAGVERDGTGRVLLVALEPVDAEGRRDVVIRRLVAGGAGLSIDPSFTVTTIDAGEFEGVVRTGVAGDVALVLVQDETLPGGLLVRVDQAGTRQDSTLAWRHPGFALTAGVSVADLAVRPDGSALVAAVDTGNALGLVDTYDASGALVAAWGSGGRTVTDQPRLRERTFPGRSVVWADGSFSLEAGSSATLERRRADGTVDAAYGDNGVASAPVRLRPTSGNLVRGLTASTADGGVVVGGTTLANDAIVLRYTPTGRLDTSFGTAGYVKAGAGRRVVDVVVDRQGRILVLHDDPIGGGDVRVTRVQGNGVLDGGYGTAGTAAIGTGDARALGVDGSGRAVVAVTSPGGATLRRLTAGGAVDGAYQPPDLGPIDRLAVHADGTVVAAWADVSARVAPTGTVTTSTGVVVRGLVVDASDRLVTIGIVRLANPTTGAQEAFHRVDRRLPNGAADPAFGGERTLYSLPYFNSSTHALGNIGAGVDAQDRVFVIGWSFSPSFVSAFRLLGSVAADPDADDDGVDDTIDSGVGAWTDPVDGAPATTGRIVDAGGLPVTVTDAPDPDGVRVVVGGSGAATTTVSACGFTIRLAAGSDVVITCGSVRVDVATGTATVELGDGGSVRVGAGGSAKVALDSGAVAITGIRGAVAAIDASGAGTTLPAGGTTPLLCGGRVATIVGTAGADRLNGTTGPDVIVGRGGNDTIDAGGGDDLVCTGAGRDTVELGPGNDRAYTGAGTDRVSGGPGDDVVDAGDDADTVDGGPGNDRLIGGAGDDSLTGGPGDDTLDGGLGSDSCAGGPGANAALGCER